jgi:Mn-dependent DtxR family transcriptional regulator
MVKSIHWRTRLKIKLLSRAGLPVATIAQALECNPKTVLKYAEKMQDKNLFIQLLNRLDTMKVFE